MRISDWSSDVCSSDLGGPPANPQALAHPTIQQLAIITGQIAIDPHRERLVVAHENPAALLPALKIERQAIMVRQILGNAWNAIAIEVLRRAAHHTPVRKQAHRDVIGVANLSDADGHIVAFAQDRKSTRLNSSH